MTEEKEKTYRVTIAVSGTRIGDVADLIRIFADTIEEGVHEEEGSIGMAEGSYNVHQIDPSDEASEETGSVSEK